MNGLARMVGAGGILAQECACATCGIMDSERQSKLRHTCAASSKVLVLWLPPRPNEYISLSVMTAGCLQDEGKKRSE